MCTVAVVSLEDGAYLLGHNRDESLARSRGLPPRLRRAGDRSFLAPIDPEAGGTWIAVNDVGLTLCMLNAADDDPGRLPPHPTSRGHVASELARCDSLDSVAGGLAAMADRLSEMRAFEVIAVAAGDAARPATLARHRWDGARLRHESVSPPALFVSALLDQSGAERERGESWARYRKSGDPGSPTRMASWLANHEPERGMLSTCVHREDARTVSRTLVLVTADACRVRYHDGSPCDAEASETRYRLER